jgi:hypothetical protein
MKNFLLLDEANKEKMQKAPRESSLKLTNNFHAFDRHPVKCSPSTASPAVRLFSPSAQCTKLSSFVFQSTQLCAKALGCVEWRTAGHSREREIR